MDCNEITVVGKIEEDSKSGGGWNGEGSEMRWLEKAESSLA
jgi:hypothetical protein